MRKFTKKDLFFSIITGLTAGIVAWQVILFLKINLPFGIPAAVLVAGVPILWILGVNLGYFLGAWIPAFNQFGKFAAVGFTNFLVDTGILNLLIFISEINSGFVFSAFKAISFFGATVHSYLWNKIWVFEADTQGQESQTFGKFVSVALAAIIVNVGVATLVVFLGPRFGLDGNVWANIASIFGSATALVFSFLGFRLFVFKKNQSSTGI